MFERTQPTVRDKDEEQEQEAPPAKLENARGEGTQRHRQDTEPVDGAAATDLPHGVESQRQPIQG